MERSAPPLDDNDDRGGAEAAPSAAHAAPSAPVLDEEDEGLVEAVRPGRSAERERERNSGEMGRRVSEALPGYWR